MSHLTASPFNKPSPYDIPYAVHPLTPPDTESEFLGQTPAVAPASTATGPAPELDHAFAPSSVTAFPMSASIQLPSAEAESPGARFRRVSTLSYRNSSLRTETRDRGRSSKSLIVVIPPAAFSQEHGQLGHTLSSGPRSRLVHGLLMPLFPTMYGQLNAIAREYNFPSTSGICLYLHITESATTITPRVSDDSWQYLWAHVFDARSPSTPGQQLPIGGRIEFDIDLRKARWYDTWISASYKEPEDSPSLVGSRPQHILHGRDDSRASIPDDHSGHEQSDSFSVNLPTKTLTLATRHIPRKLSLVDRFESFSSHSGSRAPSQTPSRADTVPMDYVESQAILAPIAQEEEPKTAKQDLQQRVNSWRASASLTPTALAANGQTSLEPANIPNTLPLDSNEVRTEKESALNLDDYTWSASSAGPPSDWPDTPVSWEHVLSIHLDRRNEGSVGLTPTTCTSFGPFDYDLYSPAPTVSPLPSPDLGMRMLEDSPPTPSTVTSWGPPSYPSSPALSNYRFPSPDIAYRTMPSSLSSPSFGAQNFDAGQIMSYSIESSTRYDSPSLLSHPMSKGIPLADLQLPIAHFPSHYPHLSLYQEVYPRFSLYPAIAAQDVDIARKSVTVRLPVDYPVIDIYPVVYPHLEIYPILFRQCETVPGKNAVVSAVVEKPGAAPWSHVWPYKRTVPVPSKQSIRSFCSGYPCFHLYPAVYSHLGLHRPRPADVKDVGEAKNTASIGSPLSYPQFDLYPAVYPNFNIYPALLSETQTALLESTTVASPVVIELPIAYPLFDIYPAVYPNNLVEIYSIIPANRPQTKALCVRLAATYPVLDLYPAVYPHFDLYPTILEELGEEISGTTCSAKLAHSFFKMQNIDVFPPVSLQLQAQHPALDIYPTVYPHFDIYRSSLSVVYETLGSPIAVNPTAQYPSFDIYQSARRTSHIDGSRSAEALKSTYSPITVKLFALYPAFDLYPSVYPHFNIYRSGSSSAAELEPLVYPSPNIHDSGSNHARNWNASIPLTTKLPASYPALDIYPPVYPHFELWPAVTVSQALTSPIKPHYRSSHAELDSSIMAEDTKVFGRWPSRGVRTHHELHQAIFPDDTVSTPSGSPMIEQGITEPNSSRERLPRVQWDGYLSNASRRRVSFAPEVIEVNPRTRARTGSINITRPLPATPSTFSGANRPPIITDMAADSSPSRRLSRGLPSNPRDSLILKPKPAPLSTNIPSSPSTTRRGQIALSPVREQPVNPATTLGRAKSESRKSLLPKRAADVARGVDRSKSLSEVHSPRKRDSLVLQRVRAFDSSLAPESKDQPTRITMESLSKFPMPPASPISAVSPVAKLDRSKFPFA